MRGQRRLLLWRHLSCAASVSLGVACNTSRLETVVAGETNPVVADGGRTDEGPTPEASAGDAGRLVDSGTLDGGSDGHAKDAGVIVTKDGGVANEDDAGVLDGGTGDGGSNTWPQTDAGLPDLVPDLGALERSLVIENRTFGFDACVIEEACVLGPGERRLLRFATTTLNLGTADLRVGDPVGNPAFTYSPCHYHYHFDGFAAYRLLRMDGTLAAAGHKQAFCLMDGSPRTDDAGPPQFHCDHQGLSRGWADTYDVVDCQWIDITGVEPGEYIVEIEVNPDRVIPELDHTNNIIQTLFTVPPDESNCSQQVEICGDNIDQNCDGVPDDGCPAITGHDRCDTAHPLGGDGVYRASLAGAAHDYETGCGGSGKDVVFRLDLNVPELIYLSTFGSSSDTTLSVWEGGCGAGQELQCVDDTCGSDGAHFMARLEPGQYYFVVQAKDTNADGEVWLKLQRSHCAEAMALPDTGTVYGDTRDEADLDRPICALGAGPDEFWYFTTCPGETPVQLSTCGTDSFQTLLELREGTCTSAGGYACSASDPSCGEGNGASALDVALQSATGLGDGMWFLLVDGFGPDDEGEYQLEVSFNP